LNRNDATQNDESTLAFNQLEPHEMLSALEQVGFRCDGRFLTLNSYENRVYQVGIEDGPPVVTKFYRPNRWSDEAILEEHGFSEELANHEIPVVAPIRTDGTTLHRHGPFRFSVSPCMGGRSPELDDTPLLKQLGRLVARIHLVGSTGRFRARPMLDRETYGDRAVDYLIEGGFIPPDLEDAYESVADHLLDQVDACYEHAGDVQELRIHGDFHPGNVLVAGDRLHIVDLDDTRTGPAIQDLWMFLSGDRAEQAPQLAALLEGYREFRNFDARELWLVEALRTLRIMHYAAWLARRRDDPAFQRAFPWFDTRRYWDDHVLTLREQISAMQEGPLPVTDR